jgi:transposase-like protein
MSEKIVESGPVSLSREDLLDFNRKFWTEEACREALFQWRWAKGYKCPECGYAEAYYHQPRHLYHCKGCGYQASLTAGTIFHRTRVPLRKWFLLIFLLARSAEGYRLYQLQDILGIGSTRTFWRMKNTIQAKLSKGNKSEKFNALVKLICNTKAKD